MDIQPSSSMTQSSFGEGGMTQKGLAMCSTPLMSVSMGYVLPNGALRDWEGVGWIGNRAPQSLGAMSEVLT